jgi:hypothetical protein
MLDRSNERVDQIIRFTDYLKTREALDTPRAMPNQGAARPVSGNQTDIVAFSFNVHLN